MVRYKDWIEMREKADKESTKKNFQLLVKLIKKSNESLAPWKENIKKWGVAHFAL